jgi:hypothetical protein
MNANYRVFAKALIVAEHPAPQVSGAGGEPGTSRPAYVYSVGWDLRERERHAIDLVPEQAWQIAIDHRGQVRERRAETACDNIGCAHRKCWVEQAHVTELTPAAARRPGRRPARQLARQRPSCVAN